MIYELIGALVFPLDKTSQPVASTPAARIFAQVLLPILAAAAATVGAGDAPGNRKAPPAQGINPTEFSARST
jgi:hypothetical protein